MKPLFIEQTDASDQEWTDNDGYRLMNNTMGSLFDNMEEGPEGAGAGPSLPQPSAYCCPEDTGHCRRHASITHTERARHAILSFRLRWPYLIYCVVIFVFTLFLFCWNVVKGMENNWNLPQWKHHPWEEVMEVLIGACMTIETFITLRLLGVKTFFRNSWHTFDFVVMMLTILSILYGLEHLGRRGEICEADVPLLMIRFILQPIRVMATLASTCRTREMQVSIEELKVDFDMLPPNDIGRFGRLP